ncbi:pitrilysin [Candidatus Profftia sp. (ex Adelges kitamiensis)]|uniref:pitrilysin n=1 Tax=Candidatus Profftia sp. (ex Adelges kitamiensis) TaxID=2864218 RepID=UPI001CE2C9C2|nr:pitrilysin [Candidatus Profftia sp. (ex Adelges kitamiensis)]
MRRQFMLLTLIILLLIIIFFLSLNMGLTKNTYSGWRVLNEKVSKSNRDPRLYKAIKLDNGMKVILVSDKCAPKSLAALALPVGSLEDPDSQLGLAHYLEHLVLMGSKRYPQTYNLAEFLKKHGGRYNASTASYRTAFYLEVENDALSPAVDRLADAITAPLLNPINSDRERNAINSELTMARSRDSMRIAQVSAETLNPIHPSSRFAGGNMETLSDKPNSNLHQERLLFYHRYYSANLMVGVIYSNQPLSILIKLAVTSFGRITNRHASVRPITVPVVTAEHQGIIIHYVPVQPYKMLKIEYRIENNSAKFRSKTDYYISYMIGSHSKNTLCDWLQKQGLAESISAGYDPIVDRNGGIFSINILLTDKGLSQRDNVIAAVYSYLKLIREHGVKRSYFNEMAHVLAIDFRYPSITHDLDYVEHLVDNMLRVPIKNILDSSYLADQYDAKAINKRLYSMIPNNARIWFISPNEPHNKTAYFLNAQYQVDRITIKQLISWGNLEKHILLSLPELNPYIPDNFSLIKSVMPKITKPKMVLNKDTMRVLYMQSRYFDNEPKANITLALRNMVYSNSIEAHIIFVLMNYMASIALDQLTYQASIGGINFSTNYNHGLTINVSGFTQYLPKLLSKLIKCYINFDLTTEHLEQAKSWYRGQLDAYKKVKAFEQAIQPIQAISIVPYVEHSKRRAFLEKVTLSDIKKYRNQLITESKIEVLVLGNITISQVKDITYNLCKYIKCHGKSWWHGKDIMLHNKQLANIQRKGSSTDSALGAVYVPIGYNEIQGMAHSNVLNQIIQPWFYEQLRTKEQLGYAVFSYPALIGHQWGIGFLLQSNNYTPDYIYNRYITFYYQSYKHLQSLKENDFNQYKLALVNQLKQCPQTLSEEVGRFLNDFNHGNFEFNTREKLIDHIYSLKLQNIIDFYYRAVIQHKGMALLSQVLGIHAQGYYAVPNGWMTYNSISELQRICLLRL